MVLNFEWTFGLVFGIEHLDTSQEPEFGMPYMLIIHLGICRLVLVPNT